MLNIGNNRKEYAKQKNTCSNDRGRRKGEPDIPAYIYNSLFKTVPERANSHIDTRLFSHH